MLFSDHNVPTTNARELTKGSKEVDFHLDFISQNKQKIATWGWGLMNLGQLTALTRPFLWRHPQKKTQIPNFTIFSIETGKHPVSVEGLNNSPTPSVSKL